MENSYVLMQLRTLRKVHCFLVLFYFSIVHQVIQFPKISEASRPTTLMDFSSCYLNLLRFWYLTYLLSPLSFKNLAHCNKGTIHQLANHSYYFLPLTYCKSNDSICDPSNYVKNLTYILLDLEA